MMLSFCLFGSIMLENTGFELTLSSHQTLLELGASPDYKDSRGLTPLYHSVVVGGDPGCCELLLNHHAFVCCQDENGWHEVHQVNTHTHTHRSTEGLVAVYLPQLALRNTHSLSRLWASVFAAVTHPRR